MPNTNHDNARARLRYISVGAWRDARLCERCADAGYQLVDGAGPADLILIDLRHAPWTLRRAEAMTDECRRSAPEAAVLFLVDESDAAANGLALRRYGDVLPVSTQADHVLRRIRGTLRLRNLAEEAGERLKTLTTLGRAVDFPVISTDASRPRALIVGAPGPAALACANALATVCSASVCVLTPGQAMRALDHGSFDLAVFLPTKKQAPNGAFVRALRRHRNHGAVAIVQIGETADNLADLAKRGGAEFLLASQIEATLAARAKILARRTRLAASLRRFLTACAGDGVRDPAAGVFTPRFLNEHGPRLAARASQTRRSLSLISIRLSLGATDTARARSSAIQETARILSTITRAEDLIARLAPDLLIAVCSATALRDAERVAARISGVLSQTAFRTTEDAAPFALAVSTSAVEHALDAPFAESVARAVGDVHALQPAMRWKRATPAREPV
ncbi:MAG: hypothetical protein AAFW81_11645 [Pseudomonadota bacterium]